MLRFPIFVSLSWFFELYMPNKVKNLNAHVVWPGYWLRRRVMRSAVDKNNRDITLIPRRSSRYPEVKLADLDYTDDIALFEELENTMAETTEAISATAGKHGLQMSF